MLDGEKKSRPYAALEQFLLYLGRPGAMSLLMVLIDAGAEGASFRELIERGVVAPRTASRRLVELKHLGLVEIERKSSRVPPRVYYYPTPLLNQLAPIFRQLYQIEKETGTLSRATKRLIQGGS